MWGWHGYPQLPRVMYYANPPGHLPLHSDTGAQPPGPELWFLDDVWEKAGRMSCCELNESGLLGPESHGEMQGRASTPQEEPLWGYAPEKNTGGEKTRTTMVTSLTLKPGVQSIFVRSEDVGCIRLRGELQRPDQNAPQLGETLVFLHP